MKTKSFVTGICGFVGSHLAEYLLSKDEEVSGIKRWRSSMDNIDHIKDKLFLYDCDLLEPSNLYSVISEIKPDYVFHLAAQSFVPYSFENPTQTLRVNGEGTMNLLEAVRKAKETFGIDPIIHICGSSEYYGQVKKEETPITEVQPFRPQSPYGASKVIEDALGSMYYRIYGLKTFVTRSFTHSGPRRSDIFFISAFAKQIALIEAGKQEPVIYVGNLDSVRTIMDVRDTVRAYYMLSRDRKFGEAYNIGGDRTVTVREVLDILLSLSFYKSKIQIKVRQSLLRPVDVTLQIPDCSKLQKRIDWKPVIMLEKTLLDTLDFWREKI